MQVNELSQVNKESAANLICSLIYLLPKKSKFKYKQIAGKFDSIDFHDLGENTEYVSFSVSMKITFKKGRSKQLLKYNLDFIDSFTFTSTYLFNPTHNISENVLQKQNKTKNR